MNEFDAGNVSRRKKLKPEVGLGSDVQRVSLVESTTSQDNSTSTTTSRLPDLSELKMNSLPRDVNGKSSGSGFTADAAKKLGFGPSLNIESPKIQKHLTKLSSHSNVLSAKIGDSLSGYMEKISMKMRNENLGVLSADFPDRKKSPPTAKKSPGKFGTVEFPLLMSDGGGVGVGVGGENSSNIYEVIEVPKPGQVFSINVIKKFLEFPSRILFLFVFDGFLEVISLNITF